MLPDVRIPNAVRPTPGQGLTLGLDGKLPPGVTAGRYVDLGSVSGTVNIDASLGTVFAVTTTASNVTWAAPTNPTVGQTIMIVNLQSGYSTSSYSINAIWKTANPTSVFSSTATGKYGVHCFVYNGVNWINTSQLTAIG